MAKLGNRARMTVSSTGTGAVSLNLAVAGFQTFLDAGLSDGDKCRYVIEDASNAWEIGVGTLSSNSTVLARSVEESSNSGNPLNLTSAAEVFCGVTANDLDNAAPVFINTIPTVLNLETNGSSAVSLNAQAVDEGGIPVTYDWDGWVSGSSTIYNSTNLPPQFASAPSINQTTGVYSLTGSSNTANAGLLNFRMKVSDGVKVATHVSVVRLAFFPVTSGLVGLYDCAIPSSYSGSGTTWSDISGNSGPNLTLLSSTTFNSSGIGAQPSLSFSELNSIKTTSSFGSSATVVAIVQLDGPANPGSTPRLTFFGRGDSNTDPFGFDMNDGNSSTTLQSSSTYRLSSNGSNDADTLTVDKVDRSNATRDQAADFMYLSQGAAGQMHSVVLKTADLSGGFSLQSRVTGSGGGEVTKGQIRALSFFNRSITTSEIAQIHAYYKYDYPSATHMTS